MKTRVLSLALACSAAYMSASVLGGCGGSTTVQPTVNIPPPTQTVTTAPMAPPPTIVAVGPTWVPGGVYDEVANHMALRARRGHAREAQVRLHVAVGVGARGLALQDLPVEKEHGRHRRAAVALGQVALGVGLGALGWAGGIGAQEICVTSALGLCDFISAMERRFCASSLRISFSSVGCSARSKDSEQPVHSWKCSQITLGRRAAPSRRRARSVRCVRSSGRTSRGGRCAVR